MELGPRMAVLAAAVVLPLGAAAASYALADNGGLPDVPSQVRIGESGREPATPAPPAPTSAPTSVTTAPSTNPPPGQPGTRTRVVQPSPPVSDDDDDADDGGGGGGGDDRDGDDD